MFRHSRNGRQLRASLGTRDEAEAVRKAEAILAAEDLVEGADFADEIEKYLAERRAADRLSRHVVAIRRSVLLRFVRESKRARVAAVTPGDAQAWHDALDVTAESRQTYVRWLRTFFKWLIERRKLRDNPFAKVKMSRARPVGRKGTVTKADAARLIAASTDPELTFALYCGFHAGMRKEEVIESRPEWFDLDSKQIYIGPTATWVPKDREARAVPISNAFAAFLAGYGRPMPYMIAPTKTRKTPETRYRHDFKKAYSAHVEACGLKCSFHDARRSFASHLVSAGVSIYKVAKWLGDGVAVVERHYGHMQPDNGDLERGIG